MKRAIGVAGILVVSSAVFVILTRPLTVLSHPAGAASLGRAIANGNQNSSTESSSDGFLLVWRSNRSDRHFPEGTLVGQRYLSDGTPNGGEFAADLDSSYAMVWAAPNASFYVYQKAGPLEPPTREALATAYINNVVTGGAAPDLNGDGKSDVLDAFALLNERFQDGPAGATFREPLAAATSDVMTAGTVTAPGTGVVRVPVYVRDNPGTPIGTDQPSLRKITIISFQIVYGPIGCVTTVSPYVDVTVGVLSGPYDYFNAPFVQGTSQGMVYNRTESKGLIPFTGGDDEIAEVVFSLNGCAPGTVIPLTFASDLTALGSQDNTNETTANGTLSLVNGSITVVASPTPTPTATPTAAPTATPTPTPTACLTGDVNGDGIVNEDDVRYLRAYLAGRGPAPVCSGDVNGDGQVNQLDVKALQNLVHGK
jgi:hypothetical protein